MPTIKTQEHAAVEKPSSKPGRKALTSEPKNKRTAQNRAAQRAFRERKERRMKELEEKVIALENEKLQIANETELLRIQVRALMKQLNKGDANGDGGPITVNDGMLGMMDDQTKKSLIDYNNRVALGMSSKVSNDGSVYDNASMTSMSSNNNTPASNPSSTSYFSDEMPQLTSKKFSFNMITPESVVVNGPGTTSSGTSTSMSSRVGTGTGTGAGIGNADLLDKMNNSAFKDEYDESNFCHELSQVCGTKECPMPKVKVERSPTETGTGNGGLLLNTVKSSSNTAKSSPSTGDGSGDGDGVAKSTITTKSPFTSSLYDGSLTSGSPGFLGDFHQSSGNSSIDIGNTNNFLWGMGLSPSPNDAKVDGNAFVNTGLPAFNFDTNTNTNTNTNIDTHTHTDTQLEKKTTMPTDLALPAHGPLVTNNEIDFLFSDENKVREETNKLIENKPEAFQLQPDSVLFSDPLGFELDYDYDQDDVFDDLLNLSGAGAGANSGLNASSNKEDPLLAADVNAPTPVFANSQQSTGTSTSTGTGVTNDDDDENEQVPDNTGNLMKCSQIWERITTHPRFTDLDIDNLCDELKQKAKCSEAGVVVNGNEVGKLLQKAVDEKQLRSQQLRELDVRRQTLSANNPSFFHGM